MNKEILELKIKLAEILDAMHSQLECAQKGSHPNKKIGVKPKVDLQRQGGLVFIPKDENKLMKSSLTLNFLMLIGVE